MVSTRAHDADYVDSPGASQSQSQSQRRGRSRSHLAESSSPPPSGPSHYDLRATPQRQRSTTPQPGLPFSPLSPIAAAGKPRRTPRSQAKAPATATANGTPVPASQSRRSRSGAATSSSTSTSKEVFVEIPRVRGLAQHTDELAAHFLPPTPAPRSAEDGASQSSASASVTASAQGESSTISADARSEDEEPMLAESAESSQAGLAEAARDIAAEEEDSEDAESAQGMDAELSGEAVSAAERELLDGVTDSEGGEDQAEVVDDAPHSEESGADDDDDEEEEEKEEEEDDESSSDSDSESDADSSASTSTSASTITPASPGADDLDALLQKALRTAQEAEASKSGAENGDVFQADVMQLEKAPRRERPIPGLTVPYLPPKLLHVSNDMEQRRKDKGKGKAEGQDKSAPVSRKKITELEVDDAVYQPQLSRSQKLKLPKTQSTNEAWASLPTIPSALLPQLKRDYQALSLSNSLDPKRFMKGGNSKGKVPEKFAIGTLINPPRHLQSSTVSATPIYRPGSIVNSLVSDAELGSYAKRKFGELQGKRIENGRGKGWKKRKGGW